MSYSKEYLQFFINTFNDFGWEKSEHSTDEIIIFHAPHKGYSYAAVTINTSEFLKDGSYKATPWPDEVLSLEIPLDDNFLKTKGENK
jgi:hypothetical protein